MWLALVLLIGVGASLQFRPLRPYPLWLAVALQLANAFALSAHLLTITQSRKLTAAAGALLYFGFVFLLRRLADGMERESQRRKAADDVWRSCAKSVLKQARLGGKVKAETRQQLVEASEACSRLLNKPDWRSRAFLQVACTVLLVTGVILGVVFFRVS